MIFDCFIMSEELDLLELRLRMLGSFVDYFVLCEAPFTFRGNAKSLAFAESGSRFDPWRAKIVHVVFPGPPQSADPWQNEWNQRDYLAEGLAGRATPDDLVLLSDCDEIPAPKHVVRRPARKRLVGHRQRHSRGYVNYVLEEPWLGTRALLWRDFERFRGFSDIRRRPEPEHEIVEGGWHLSSFGGAAAMQIKMQSYAHSEFDIPYLTDRRRLDAHYASESEAHWVELDASFPAIFREDPRWAPYVAQRPEIGVAHSLALQHAHGCFAYVPDAAPSVAVLAHDDVGAWQEAGVRRFGERFAGVEPGVGSLRARLGGVEWLVVDRLELQSNDELAELCASQAGIVGYALNACSFFTFDRVLSGEPFAPGRAVTSRDLRARVARLDRAADRIDRVQTAGVFAPWSKMPEMLYDVALGSNFRFARIGRDDLAEFLAEAIILTWQPRHQTT